MKHLNSVESGKFFVLYGRSGSGKTHFAGTFPKVLFIAFKDNGLGTVKNVDGDYINFDGSFEEMLNLIEELKHDPNHYTFVFDTFGVYVDTLQKTMMSLLRKKAMTQQMWGDLGTQVKIILDSLKELATERIVVITFHESAEVIEGYEQELTPTVGCFVTPSIKKALYGVANYALHTFIYNYLDPATQKSMPVFALHIGTNPFYWTKFQRPDTVQIPEFIFNPTFTEVDKLINPERYK